MSSETNPRLEFFRSQIGNSLSQSPSPLGRWLNGTLKEASHGLMTVEFLVREEMTNPMGVLHGGVAAAMMVYALGREYGYTSVNLNCDFLSAAREGEVLTVQAHVIRAGKNIIHGECRIVNETGKIIAKTATNLIQTGVKLPF